MQLHNFRARQVDGKWRVYCRTCMTTTVTGAEKLPHDTASKHRCLYTPETE